MTDEAIEGLLDKMNNDFGYFRDSLGWLPDKRARRGYYSTVYLYGSGLYSDPADSTALGGWQGATWYNGENWPMVNLSYYPVACFDPDFTYDSYHNANLSMTRRHSRTLVSTRASMPSLPTWRVARTLLGSRSRATPLCRPMPN